VKSQTSASARGNGIAQILRFAIRAIISHLFGESLGL
jgi:hypothetical protein